MKPKTGFHHRLFITVASLLCGLWGWCGPALSLPAEDARADGTSAFSTPEQALTQAVPAPSQAVDTQALTDGGTLPSSNPGNDSATESVARPPVTGNAGTPPASFRRVYVPESLIDELPTRGKSYWPVRASDFERWAEQHQKRGTSKQPQTSEVLAESAHYTAILRLEDTLEGSAQLYVRKTSQTTPAAKTAPLFWQFESVSFAIDDTYGIRVQKANEAKDTTVPSTTPALPVLRELHFLPNGFSSFRFLASDFQDDHCLLNFQWSQKSTSPTPGKRTWWLNFLPSTDTILDLAVPAKWKPSLSHGIAEQLEPPKPDLLDGNWTYWRFHLGGQNSVELQLTDESADPTATRLAQEETGTDAPEETAGGARTLAGSLPPVSFSQDTAYRFARKGLEVVSLLHLDCLDEPETANSATGLHGRKVLYLQVGGEMLVVSAKLNGTPMKWSYEQRPENPNEPENETTTESTGDAETTGETPKDAGRLGESASPSTSDAPANPAGMPPTATPRSTVKFLVIELPEPLTGTENLLEIRAIQPPAQYAKHSATALLVPLPKVRLCDAIWKSSSVAIDVVQPLEVVDWTLENAVLERNYRPALGDSTDTTPFARFLSSTASQSATSNSTAPQAHAHQTATTESHVETPFDSTVNPTESVRRLVFRETQETSEIQLALRNPPATISVSLATAIDFQENAILSQTNLTASIEDGESFELQGLVDHSWTIDTIESDPMGLVEDWRLEPTEGTVPLPQSPSTSDSSRDSQETPRQGWWNSHAPSVLHIQLSHSLRKDHPVSLKIRARRLDSANRESFTAAELAPVFFPDYHRAESWILVGMTHLWQVHFQDPYQPLDFFSEQETAGTPFLTFSTTLAQARAFFDPKTPFRVSYQDFKATPMLKLTRRSRVYHATVRGFFDFAATPRAIYRIQCDPQGSVIDRVRVQIRPAPMFGVTWNFPSTLAGSEAVCVERRIFNSTGTEESLPLDTTQNNPLNSNSNPTLNPNPNQDQGKAQDQGQNQDQEQNQGQGKNQDSGRNLSQNQGGDQSQDANPSPEANPNQELGQSANRQNLLSQQASEVWEIRLRNPQKEAFTFELVLNTPLEEEERQLEAQQAALAQQNRKSAGQTSTPAVKATAETLGAPAVETTTETPSTPAAKPTETELPKSPSQASVHSSEASLETSSEIPPSELPLATPEEQAEVMDHPEIWWEQHFPNGVCLPLVNLPDAEQCAAEVSLRRDIATAISVLPQDLSPELASDTGEFGPQPLSRSNVGVWKYRYEPQNLLNTIAPTLRLSWQKPNQTTLSPAWIWKQELHSQFFANGISLHVVSMSIENTGVDPLRLTRAPQDGARDEASLFRVLVNGHAVPEATTSNGSFKNSPSYSRTAENQLSITLPTGRRHNRVVVQWVQHGKHLSVRPVLPRPQIQTNFPVLQSTWQIWVPENYVALNEHDKIHGSEIQDTVLLRFFGSLRFGRSIFVTGSHANHPEHFAPFKTPFEDLVEETAPLSETEEMQSLVHHSQHDLQTKDSQSDTPVERAVFQALQSNDQTTDANAHRLNADWNAYVRTSTLPLVVINGNAMEAMRCFNLLLFFWIFVFWLKKQPLLQISTCGLSAVLCLVLPLVYSPILSGIFLGGILAFVLKTVQHYRLRRSKKNAPVVLHIAEERKTTAKPAGASTLAKPVETKTETSTGKATLSANSTVSSTLTGVEYSKAKSGNGPSTPSTLTVAETTSTGGNSTLTGGTSTLIGGTASTKAGPILTGGNSTSTKAGSTPAQNATPTETPNGTSSSHSQSAKRLFSLLVVCVCWSGVLSETTAQDAISQATVLLRDSAWQAQAQQQQHGNSLPWISTSTAAPTETETSRIAANQPANPKTAQATTPSSGTPTAPAGSSPAVASSPSSSESRADVPWVFIPVDAEGHPTKDEYYVPLNLLRELQAAGTNENESSNADSPSFGTHLPPDAPAYFFHRAVYSGVMAYSTTPRELVVESMTVVFDVETTEPRVPIRFPVRQEEVYISPNSVRLDGALQQVDWVNGELTVLVAKPGRHLLQISFLPVPRSGVDFQESTTSSTKRTHSSTNGSKTKSTPARSNEPTPSSFSFRIPPIANATLKLETPAIFTDVQFPTALGKASYDSSSRLWNVQLGAASVLAVQWKNPYMQTANPQVAAEELYRWNVGGRDPNVQCRVRLQTSDEGLSHLSWLADGQLQLDSTTVRVAVLPNMQSRRDANRLSSLESLRHAAKSPSERAKDAAPNYTLATPLVHVEKMGHQQRILLTFDPPLQGRILTEFLMQAPVKPEIGNHQFPQIGIENCRTSRRWIAVQPIAGFDAEVTVPEPLNSEMPQAIAIPEFLSLWDECNPMQNAPSSAIPTVPAIRPGNLVPSPLLTLPSMVTEQSAPATTANPTPTGETTPASPTPAEEAPTTNPLSVEEPTKAPSLTPPTTPPLLRMLNTPPLCVLNDTNGERQFTPWVVHLKKPTEAPVLRDQLSILCNVDSLGLHYVVAAPSPAAMPSLLHIQVPEGLDIQELTYHEGLWQRPLRFSVISPTEIGVFLERTGETPVTQDECRIVLTGRLDLPSGTGLETPPAPLQSTSEENPSRTNTTETTLVPAEESNPASTNPNGNASSASVNSAEATDDAPQASEVPTTSTATASDSTDTTAQPTPSTVTNEPSVGQKVPMPQLAVLDSNVRMAVRTVHLYRADGVIVAFQRSETQASPEMESLSPSSIAEDSEVASTASDVSRSPFPNVRQIGAWTLATNETLAGELTIRRNQPQIRLAAHTDFFMRDAASGTIRRWNPEAPARQPENTTPTAPDEASAIPNEFPAPSTEKAPLDSQAAKKQTETREKTTETVGVRLELQLQVQDGALDELLILLPKNVQGPFTLEPPFPFLLESASRELPDRSIASDATCLIIRPTRALIGTAQLAISCDLEPSEEKETLVQLPTFQFPKIQTVTQTVTLPDPSFFGHPGKATTALSEVNTPVGAASATTTTPTTTATTTTPTATATPTAPTTTPTVVTPNATSTPTSPEKHDGKTTPAAEKATSNPSSKVGQSSGAHSETGLTDVCEWTTEGMLAGENGTYQVVDRHFGARLQTTAAIRARAEAQWVSHTLLWNAPHEFIGLTAMNILPQKATECIIRLPKALEPMEFRLDSQPIQMEWVRETEDQARLYCLRLHSVSVVQRLEVLFHGQTTLFSVPYIPEQGLPKNVLEQMFHLVLPELYSPETRTVQKAEHGSFFLLLPQKEKIQFWKENDTTHALMHRPVLRMELVQLEQILQCAKQLVQHRTVVDVSETARPAESTPADESTEIATAALPESSLPSETENWLRIWKPLWDCNIARVKQQLAQDTASELQEYRDELTHLEKEGGALFRLARGSAADQNTQNSLLEIFLTNLSQDAELAAAFETDGDARFYLSLTPPEVEYRLPFLMAIVVSLVATIVALLVMALFPGLLKNIRMTPVWLMVLGVLWSISMKPAWIGHLLLLASLVLTLIRLRSARDR